MSRRSKAAGSASRVMWRWRRKIDPTQLEAWTERLAAESWMNWALIETPGLVRASLDVFVPGEREALALKKKWRGQVKAVRPVDWAGNAAQAVTRIAHGWEIAHAVPKRKSATTGSSTRLVIPHGMAFGSGEHSTTHMLLRALVSRRGDWPALRVLDLGTGSGVLALAARKLGARKIVGTDFDSDAVRVARENEALNFAMPIISWRRADVRQLRPQTQYDLVLANLFSGILCEAATPIALAVAQGGQLWLSGILRGQQEEVEAAYCATGLRLMDASRRGKWVLLKWER